MKILVLFLMLSGTSVVWAGDLGAKSSLTRTRRGNKLAGKAKKRVKWEDQVVASDEGLDVEQKVAEHLSQEIQTPCAQSGSKMQFVSQDCEFARACALISRSADALPKLSCTYTGLKLSLELHGDQVALQDSQEEIMGSKRKRTEPHVDALLGALKGVLEKSEPEDIVLAKVKLLTATHLLDRRKVQRRGAVPPRKKEGSPVVSGAGAGASVSLLSSSLTEDYFTNKE